MATDEAKSISEAVGGLIARYQWLVFDAFLFLLLVTGFAAYDGLQELGQRLVRGALVSWMWIFWLSGVHILLYMRADADEKALNKSQAGAEQEQGTSPMKKARRWMSVCMVSKGAVLLLLFVWACYVGLVSLKAT